MIRALIGLLIAAIAAAFIRAVIGLITKEVTQMVNPEAPQQGPAAGASQSTALKKCPVCGTYSQSDRLVNGQYCSKECAAKVS